MKSRFIVRVTVSIGLLLAAVGCGNEYDLAGAPDPHDLVECDFEVVGDEASPWELYTCNPFFPPPLDDGWDSPGIGGYDILVIDVLGTPLFQMWYGGGDTELEMSPTTAIDAIGYAVSTNGVDWERYEGNPLLTTADAGMQCDKIYNPTVSFDETNGIYHMWFAADVTNLGTQIGHATSADGLEWIADPHNPVIGTDEMAGTDFSAFTPGDVIVDAGGVMHMFYGGLYQVGGQIQYAVGHATSTDGSQWDLHDGQPILRGAPGQWDSKVVAFPDVFFHDTTYYLFYAGSSTVANQGNFYYVDEAQLGYATSTDAVNWERQTPDEPLPLSYVNPGYPRVYFVHDRLHIWFTDRWTTILPDDSERELAWLNYGIIDW